MASSASRCCSAVMGSGAWRADSACVGSTCEFGGGLAVAAAAANLGSGVEKDLYLCVGEDGGANVATLHNDSAGLAQSALLPDHPSAKMGMDGYLGSGGGDVGLADATGDVHAVQEDPITV